MERFDANPPPLPARLDDAPLVKRSDANPLHLPPRLDDAPHVEHSDASASIIGIEA